MAGNVPILNERIALERHKRVAEAVEPVSEAETAARFVDLGHTLTGRTIAYRSLRALLNRSADCSR